MSGMGMFRQLRAMLAAIASDGASREKKYGSQAGGQVVTFPMMFSIWL
jgi:hypothetical protein